MSIATSLQTGVLSMWMLVAAQRPLVACAVLVLGTLSSIVTAAPIPLIDFGTLPVGASTIRTVNINLLPSDSPPTFSSSFGLEFQFGSATCDSSRVNCSMDVTFSPHAPGLRQDAITVKNASNEVLGQVYLSGIGEAPQVSFVPGVLSTPVSSLGFYAIANDGAGNIYFGNGSYTGAVKKIQAGDGSVTTVAGVTFSLDALAVDGVGNLYVCDSGHVKWILKRALLPGSPVTIRRVTRVMAGRRRQRSSIIRAALL